MIIKEKRWLSRIVAMLCVLTMVVGVLTPASVGVAVTTKISEIKFKLEDGVEYYDSTDSESMNSYADDSDYVETETGKYQCKIDSEYLYVKPSKSSYFSSSVTFYAYTDNDTFALQSDTEGVTATPSYVSAYSMWRIKISISSSATGIPTISVKKQYTVNFTNNSPSDCNIYDGNSLLTGSIKYDENAPVNFDVVLNDSVKESKVPVVRYGRDVQDTPDVEKDGATYKYSIQELTANTDVIITTIDKTCSIEPNEPQPAGYNKLSSATVKYGDPYRFYVTPEAGRTIKAVYAVDSQKKFNVEAPDEETPLPEIGTNYYEITSVTTDMKIYVDVSELAKYNVLFSSGTGYTIEDIDNNKEIHNDSITYNEPCAFKVVPENGYTILNVIATSSAGTQVLPETDEKYTIEHVTSDITVTVNVRKESYYITYPSEKPKGCTVVPGASTAGYGDFVTFSVIPDEGYETPKVTANITGGETMVPVTNLGGNQYRITVTKPTTIIVGEAVTQQKTVTFNTGNGYSFLDDKSEPLTEKQVNYNTSISFKLKLDDNYSRSTPIVKVNGITVASTNNDENCYKYTIDNIKENKIVEVTGVEKNKYTVTLKNDKGYTLSTAESTHVSAGDKFSFSWRVDDGYTAKNIIIDGEPGETIAGNNDGNRTITVIKDIEISLEVGELSYIVKTPNPEESKATVKDVNPANGKIPYNGSYSFNVEAEDYYKVDTVKVDNVPILPVGGVYTINNITDNDKEITVETSPVELTIKYVDEKFDGNTKTMKYSIENENKEKVQDNGVITLLNKEELVMESVLYNFEGWIPNSVNLKDYKEDTTITLKANWELSKTVVTGGLKLSTTGSWSGNGSDYKLLFKTVIEVLNKETEYKDNVKINACGTLYAGSKIENPESYADAIKSRHGELSEQLYKHIVDAGKPIYDYYKDINNLYVGNLGEKDFFSLSLTSTKKAERHAVGWLELEIDGKIIIIFGEDCELPGN